MMSVTKTQLDNSSFPQKVMLRQTAVRMVKGAPVIMETHGGAGDIWSAVYNEVEEGVVFEKESNKADILARQRPTWAVYQADCVKALAAGAGAHLEVNLLDLDPYGSCWPAMQAFFESDRPFADQLVVVVNDGLRRQIGFGRSWQTNIFQELGVIERFGNDLWGQYAAVAEYMLGVLAVKRGYKLAFFQSYFTGRGEVLLHFLAKLIR